ncbi:hypothetical protein MTR62_05490 [Novosphingobium sp. 1949]|uniref:Thioredoxin domain-containing protein n=2 Tax=Novosphingobium organovorum TaxID=2930092 RepID=A0ABT0BB22_9SPHN|nr:hypothetical protein [Novosphingobium organovorum]MCJ2182154.1 hypothetical protein [Novosphingobium organovorum]
MMLLIVSQALLWALCLLLAVAVAVLARQVGILHERIAPVGALALSQGPQPGEQAPQLTVRTLDGAPRALGGATAKAQLLLFVAPSCPICKQLIPTAGRVAASEGADLFFLGDGDLGQYAQMAVRLSIAPDRLAVSSEAGYAFRVGKLPYAVLLRPDGTIAAQGLVNTREHIESLFTPAETGFGTVQDFLGARRAGALANDFTKVGSHG